MVRALIDDRLLTSLTDFFRSECTIQEMTMTPDATGYGVPAWADLAGHVDLPCRKAPKGGDEYKKADNTYAIDVHTIEIAGYYADIKVTHWVVIGTERYDILLVEYDGNSKLTRITAEKVK